MLATPAVAALLLLLACIGGSQQSPINGIKLKIDRINSNTQVTVSVMRFSEVVQSITFGEIFTAPITDTADATGAITIAGAGGATAPTIKLTFTTDTQALTLLRIVHSAAAAATTRSACIRLQSDRMSWFGGQQQRRQYWPVDKLTHDGYSYVTKEADSCAVAERYWLNSRGSFVHVDATVPLFIDQNLHANELCLVAKRALPYDTHATTDTTFQLAYTVGISTDAREAHQYAVAQLLGKPAGHPAESMVRDPIFSTWAKYERAVSDAVAQQFASDIVSNGYTSAQFELDDNWETCYGSLAFDATKFPDPLATTTALKAKGFRVTLWIHPFINIDCTAILKEATDNNYLVKDHSGAVLTKWWNSGDANVAAYIDFTNPAAATWYSNRLVALKAASGVDSFKFDAGESSWTPVDPVLTGNQKLVPGLITTAYVNTVANPTLFGDLIEVRTGLGTQAKAVFVRMIDKDTFWTWENGLPTLITTLLQMNMNGYPLVLPDMIGGNGYDNNPPSAELFVRWLQANVFMPALQFSFVPWDYADTPAVATITKQMVALHAQYTDEIMARFQMAVATGAPVNPPLWWVAPTDQTAHRISDQFLLGEKIIAAPVIEPGAVKRHVYLPAGQWRDGNAQTTVYVGPRWVMDYPAPLETLPYFIRVETTTT